MRAIEEFCPKIAGPIKSAYRDFTADAISLAEHKGYQDWHRLLDDLFYQSLKLKGKTMTGKDFVNFIEDIYSHSELVRKFPHAVPNIRKWAQKYGIYKL